MREIGLICVCEFVFLIFLEFLKGYMKRKMKERGVEMLLGMKGINGFSKKNISVCVVYIYKEEKGKCADRREPLVPGFGDF